MYVNGFELVLVGAVILKALSVTNLVYDTKLLIVGLVFVDDSTINCVAICAQLYAVSPACTAVIVLVPSPTIDTLLPEIVATLGLLE